MPEVPYREDLPAVISDIERRLRSLETTPRLQNSSLPWEFGIVTAEEATGSTSYADLTTAGPIVNLTFDKQGKAFITASCYVVPKANNYAAVGLFLDGTLVSDILLLGVGSSDYVYGNIASTRVIENITPGPHEFRLKYKSGTAGLPDPPSFASRSLTVQPF